MKTALITLLTRGQTLVRVKDRTGAYKLPSGKMFPTFGTAGSPKAGPPAAARPIAPVAQPALFKGLEDGSAGASPCGEITAPPRSKGQHVEISGREAPPEAREGARAPQKKTLLRAMDSLGGTPTGAMVGGTERSAPAMRGMVALRWKSLRMGPKIRAALGGAVSVFQKAGLGLLRLRPRLPQTLDFFPRRRAQDLRPRAQAELALEKVVVLRNDLSDTDFVVVPVIRKPVETVSTPTGVNSWSRVTARWIKLKEPPASGEAGACSERMGELAEIKP